MITGDGGGSGLTVALVEKVSACFLAINGKKDGKICDRVFYWRPTSGWFGRREQKGDLLREWLITIT